MDSRVTQTRMEDANKMMNVKPKVTTNKMTNKAKEKHDSVQVKHTKTNTCKDKTFNYHEGELFTLKKPVDRIHTISLGILGKKTKKKQKKTKKNKMIKKTKKHKKTKEKIKKTKKDKKNRLKTTKD